MLIQALSFCFFLILTIASVSTVRGDYCWCDYTGSIPNDAVTGGKDRYGKNTYIGQAYIKNGGLTPAQIYSGVKEVYAPYGGINKVDKNIKILCGLQKHFYSYWQPANSTNLHLTLLHKRAVLGGHDDEKGQLYIGRVYNDGETKIGKIAFYSPENAYFFFNNKGLETLLYSFEILLYNDNFNNIDSSIVSN